MNKSLITAEHVSKKYCRDLKRSLRYGVQDLVKEMLGYYQEQSVLRKSEFWAIRDVSFKLERGEVLGLIGPNGSGKSTLLKMLNGLIKPNEGCIRINGRVGALIELGAGFNPILTGRENIYINGAVLGLSKKEIDDKIDDIIQFADLEDFLDAPVQAYSSGMKVRLGFAVAINLRPDIMLVDEVLAVGDFAFRNKCMDAIQEIRNSGVAFIIVSHNLEQINRLCDRALFLKKGQVVAYDETSAVISSYLIDVPEENSEFIHFPGTEKFVWIQDVQILNSDGELVDQIISGDSLTIRITFEAMQFLETPNFLFMIEPNNRNIIAAYLSEQKKEKKPLISPGNYVLEATVDKFPLLPGYYRLRASIVGKNSGLYGKVSNLATIKVVAKKYQAVATNAGGFVDLSADLQIHSQNAISKSQGT